jgi:hypothetical protein
VQSEDRTLADGEQWLHGQAFDVHIERDPDDVFAYLVEVEHTPEWRDHLDEVKWLDEGPTGVGRRIHVTTTLAWYRRIAMTCVVTKYVPQARMFAYRVIEGPATTINEYQVLADGSGARFRMQGRVLLDSWYLRLAAPLFKLLEDRNSRRQVRALVDILERG